MPAVKISYVLTIEAEADHVLSNQDTAALSEIFRGTIVNIFKSFPDVTAVRAEPAQRNPRISDCHEGAFELWGVVIGN